MKKSTKRNIATLTACAVLGAAAVGGTLAYLTAETTTTTNTYTVGTNMAITLTEPSWTDKTDGTDDDITVVPNQTVAKDPTVTNTGDTSAIVFVKVEIPAKNFSLVDADGTVGTKQVQDVAIFKAAEDYAATYENVANTGWEILTTANDYSVSTTDGEDSVYILGYNKALAKNEVAEDAFTHIQVANALATEVSGSINIDVTAYAIQADNLVNGSGAIDTTGTLSATTLAEIYNIYANQAE